MQKGELVKFGDYNWRVLTVNEQGALMITEEIIEQRAYHNVYTDTVWADCELRRYLNGEFYESFNEQERAKILMVTNENKDNQWYGTKGGPATQDKIFLLDIEAVVCEYFGDSRSKLENKGKNQRYWFERKDENNKNRSANFRGSIWWWWLRSPGRNGVKAVYVHGDGNIGIQGNNIEKCNISLFHTLGDNRGGVRPALWLRKEE